MNTITHEEFTEVQIRIGTVLSVENVPNTEKLLKLIFDFGDEQRQIITAMATFFSDPQVLVGKQLPVLVNLEPKTFRGYESQGMILAADVNGQPVLLHPEQKVPSGSIVK